MRWNDSATDLATAVQMLTPPVATFRDVVASKSGSANDNSARRRTGNPYRAGRPKMRKVPRHHAASCTACAARFATPTRAETTVPVTHDLASSTL
jgi:hypothetical protein